MLTFAVNNICMDPLSLIKQPVSTEFSVFKDLFSKALSHPDGLLNEVLSHIRQRGGKRMRPILTLLIAKNFGSINTAIWRKRRFRCSIFTR